MRLWRAHGLGNDYLVLEQGPPLDAGLVRAICDRHRGVGGDGVLEPMDRGSCDYGLRIWNPDGSVAEKSGNGLRIFARWLADQGAPPTFTVWTGFETVTCRVGAETIAVDMGRARFRDDLRSIDVGGAELPCVALSIGNPHCVLWQQGDLDATPWRMWGRTIEVDPRFPGRTNVQIARVLSRDAAEARIWERGAGETLASGSSACAVAASGVKTGVLDPGRIEVRMPGGSLHVTVSRDYDVVLEGPVEAIGRVETDPRWEQARSRFAR